ncbi:MAG: quinol:electron acceptor oxidoreductase subunit ActD, partial [Gammaproteobacteria bacterium]
MSSVAAGLFQDPDSALAAAGRLKDAGFATPELMSPVPLHGVEEVLGEKKSVIKNFTFFGALFGGIAGFILAAGTAVFYLHPTGGRPIITFPPFLIITYEMTILFGIVFTVLGFFI